MRKIQWILLSLSASLFTSCGGSDSNDNNSTPATKYGELKTSLLDSTDVSSVDLMGASCSNNVDSGLFTASFTGVQNEVLDIKIKDFSTTPRTYTCTQAESNRDGDLGEKYSGCAIEFSVLGATAGLNTYSTYRSAEALGAFTYGGTCTVVTSYTAPKLTLVVSCSNLIQTKFNGQTRNPISQSETASVNGTTSVSCNI